MNKCNYTDCDETLTKPNIMDIAELKLTIWLCIKHQQILDEISRSP